MSTFHPDAPHYLAPCLFVYFYFVLNVEKIDVSVLAASAALLVSSSKHARTVRERRREEGLGMTQICANK